MTKLCDDVDINLQLLSAFALKIILESLDKWRATQRSECERKSSKAEWKLLAETKGMLCGMKGRKYWVKWHSVRRNGKGNEKTSRHNILQTLSGYQNGSKQMCNRKNFSVSFRARLNVSAVKVSMAFEDSQDFSKASC